MHTVRVNDSPAEDLPSPDPVTTSIPHDDDEDGPPPAGRWAALTAGLAPLVVGVIFLYASLGLGIGTPTDPRPGLWPFGLSCVLILLSLGLLIGHARFNDCEGFGKASLLVLVGAASIAVYIILLPLVGFEIPSIAVQVFWLKVLGKESWRVTAVVPIATTAAFHLLFIELLSVPIPHLIAF